MLPPIKKTRILLADDHTVVRKGIRMILSAQPDLEVVAEAKNGNEAVAEAERTLPDVVIMDVTTAAIACRRRKAADTQRQL